MSRGQRWRRRGLLLALALLLAAAAMHEHVVRSVQDRIYDAVSVPQAECILVPGARIYADGRPYPLLVDRLATALELYQRGKAKRIVLSGRGGGGIAVDEVAAMRRWLQTRGVPAEAMHDDALGLRTLDTMQRCGLVMGARSAIVVTNPFHVARSLFLGVHSGLDVRAVAAPYGTNYSTWTMCRNQGREVAARIRAWLDVFVFGA
ncbi:MAG TPA: ElyC/SanA/YdcF family protein [Planctomycetota bacterium]